MMTPATKTSSIARENFPLLELPVELQLKILKLCCTHHNPIRPEQQINRNIPTTFTHQTDSTLQQCQGDDEDDFGALTAINLAATCKSINKLVLSTEMLFYKFNTFNFSCTSSMHQYLSAITPSRRNAIRSICVFANHDLGDPVSAFSLLACCHGLRHLKLEISLSGKFFKLDANGETTFFKIPGIMQCTKLRGLKSFKLTYPDKGGRWNFLASVYKTYRHVKTTPLLEDELRIEITGLEHKINAMVTEGTIDQCQISPEEVEEAILKAEVVHRFDKLLPLSNEYVPGIEKGAQKSSPRPADFYS